MMNKIDEEEENERNAVRAEWMYKAKTEFEQRRFQSVMDNLQVDEQVKRELLYADITDVMSRYNVERADLESFREMAANAGLYMMLGGMGAFQG